MTPEKLVIGKLDSTPIQNPWETLTLRQQEFCGTVGNFILGFDKTWEERVPFQKLIALRILQTRRDKPSETAQFLDTPSSLTNQINLREAINAVRGDLFTEVKTDTQGQQCVDRFISNLAYQLRHSPTQGRTLQEAKPLPPLTTPFEKAKYIGYQLIFEQHRADSSTSLLKHALALKLDNSLRSEQPQDLPFSLGFSVTLSNPRFTACQNQEKAILDAVATLPGQPQWQTASSRLHALAIILEELESVHLESNDGLITPIESTVLHAIKLRLLDSLLYPNHSHALTEEVTDDGRMFRKWAEQISTDIITSQVVTELGENQSQRRELYAALLQACFDSSVEYYKDEENFSMPAEIIALENVRLSFIKYAKLVGTTQAIDDFQSAHNVADKLFKEYKQYQDDHPDIWYQDRFLNPIAELLNEIRTHLPIINTDRDNYLNPDVTRYFETREIKEAIKEARQPRITFVFLDPGKQKVLLVKLKVGIWVLPSEGLVEDTLERTIGHGMSKWLKGLGRLDRVLGKYVYDRVKITDQFRRNQQYTAVVTTVSPDSGTHYIPRGKTMIEQARWFPLNTLATVTSHLPDPIPTGLSIPTCTLRQGRYEEIFRLLLKSLPPDLQITNPYLEPPIEIFPQTQETQFSADDVRGESLYATDRLEGYVPTLVIAADTTGEEDGDTSTLYLMRLERTSGLLSFPQEPIMPVEGYPSAVALRNQMLSEFSGLTFYPLSLETIKRVARIDFPLERRNREASKGRLPGAKGKAYYVIYPGIKDADFGQYTVVTDSTDNRQEALKKCVDYVLFSLNERQSQQQAVFLLSADVARDIIDAQERAAVSRILETGQVGDLDPWSLRRRRWFYAEIFGNHGADY